ncbi:MULTISPECIES: rhodanese-like domain-containing protein [Nonlabens]|uniref:rhodanese-like domain-containing protein n=1 Tax=Nonlabens TaxID=363408 RepID=UPI000CF4352C|nr:rhodanese-like domain-containing protein [Nonlabens tegetincola]PQJ18280.1 hypothetical protein BST93_07185 [Nonlabens tegetincola]
MTIASGSIWHSFLEQDANPEVLYVKSENEPEGTTRFGALSIPLHNTKSFKRTIENLDKQKHYYVYSKSGKSGAIACQNMEDAGFVETINLNGGIANF